MAPELLAGREPSVESDVYALGLVLYEIFTGRRAYTAQNVRELIRQQNEMTITSPATLVKDLDPAINLGITRTLERDPADRPHSALEVAASLPGGDSLAAALAAGQTPSPEMVAAAGQRAAATRTHAILATAGVIPPRALAFLSLPRGRSAGSICASHPTSSIACTAWWRLSATVAVISYWEFGGGVWAPSRSGAPGHARRAGRRHIPSGPLRFWWRPVRGSANRRARHADDGRPAVGRLGMTLVGMDPQGRLLRFSACSRRLTTILPSRRPTTRALQAGGPDMSQFQSAEPQSLAGTAFQRGMDGIDARRPYGGARRSRLLARPPIYFEVLMPWAKPRRMETAPASLMSRILSGTESIATLGSVDRHVHRAAQRPGGTGRHDRGHDSRDAAVAGKLLAWCSLAVSRRG